MDENNDMQIGNIITFYEFYSRERLFLFFPFSLSYSFSLIILLLR